MVRVYSRAGTVAIVYSLLLGTYGLSAASPLYNSETDTVTSGAGFPASTNIDRAPIPTTTGDSITRSVGNNSYSLDGHSATSTSSSNVSSATTRGPQYTTLGNGVWQVFTSKSERPIASISWASQMPEVEKCWSDIVDWRNSSISWWNKYIASTTFSNSVLTTQTMIWGVSETTWEKTIYPTSVSAYTLCDGTPRVDARPETRTTTYNVTSTSTLVVPSEYAFPQTQPCVPDPRTCRLWYYESNINVTNRDELFQQCGKPAGLYQPCLVGGGPVQLIYWPEESDDSNFCPNNASMPLQHSSRVSNTSAASLPDTVTAFGQTFTSGSVYLSFHTLYASYDGFYDRVGPTFRDTIIPVPSSAMSTHCGGFTEAHGPGTSLNYADLNWPVAASAYNCQARCDQRFVPRANRSATPTECKTIWSDVNPNIAIPTLVKDLVPEWASCEMSGFRIPNFWFDPPVMLTKKESIVVPTTPHAQPTKEPAAPSSAFMSSGPVETGLAVGSEGDGEESDVARPPKPAASEIVASATATGSEAGITSTGESQADSAASLTPETRPASSEDASPEQPYSSKTTTTDESAVEEISNLEKTTETGTFSTPFSYQPRSSSLNALSVLQSALSAISGAQSSEAASSGPTGTDAVAGTNPTSDHDVSTHITGGLITSIVPMDSSAHTSEETTETSNTGPAQPTIGSNDVPHVTESIVTGVQTSTTSNYAAYTPPTSDANQISYVGSDEPTSATHTGGDLPSVVVDPEPELSTLAAADLTLTVSSVSGSSAVGIGSHTLHSDDPVATIGSHIVSAGSSGLVILSSESTIAFTSISATSGAERTTLAADTLTLTANPVQGSPDVISIGGTTLSEGGDAATLEGGQTLSYGSSGVAVVGSNSNMLMSSVAVVQASSSSSSASAGTSTDDVDLPFVTSEATESIGIRISVGRLSASCGLLLGWAVVVLFW